MRGCTFYVRRTLLTEAYVLRTGCSRWLIRQLERTIKIKHNQVKYENATPLPFFILTFLIKAIERWVTAPRPVQFDALI